MDTGLPPIEAAIRVLEPGAASSIGARYQTPPPSWARVTTGCSPEKSTEPMLPSVAPPWLNHSLPCGQATLSGLSPTV